MPIHERIRSVVEETERTLKVLSARKHTGEVTITVDMNDGGIGGMKKSYVECVKIRG
jgi:hypothetical protein